MQILNSTDWLWHFLEVELNDVLIFEVEVVNEDWIFSHSCKFHHRIWIRIFVVSKLWQFDLRNKRKLLG